VNLRFALAFALGLSTLATVAHVDSAEAGRYRFGGGGSVRVHAHARTAPGGVSVTYSRSPRYSPSRTWSVGGSVYVGPRYSYYPRYRYYRPYYYYNYYYPVPSYYGYYEQSYYPVAPAPAAAPVVTAAAPAPRRELPKFGIGLFAGGVSVENVDESSDLGVLGRYRLTSGLLIEGELGKTSYADNLRVDRRLGASLVYEIGAHNRFAPYVLAGLGAQQADVSGEFNTTQNFGELGIGLRFAVTPNVHILADIRAGSRASVSSDEPTDLAARSVSPPSASSDESEEYTRARLAAALYF
jgi:Outer membrane protein beta-barrel domain